MSVWSLIGLYNSARARELGVFVQTDRRFHGFHWWPISLEDHWGPAPSLNKLLMLLYMVCADGTLHIPLHTCAVKGWSIIGSVGWNGVHVVPSYVEICIKSQIVIVKLSVIHVPVDICYHCVYAHLTPIISAYISGNHQIWVLNLKTAPYKLTW